MSSLQNMALPDDALLDTGESKSSLTGSRKDNKTGFSQQENVDSRARQLFYRHQGIFSKFMRRVSRLPRLREDLVEEEVLGRQKRRELRFKMNDVSNSDARFMKEVQGLTALGKLEEFPVLLRLANECQQARDKVGPLEADCTEAEQELELKLSELQLAEISAYEFFDKNLHTTKLNSSGPPSPSSSQYGSSSSSSSPSSDNNSQYLEDDFTDAQNDLRYQPIPTISPPGHSSILEVRPPTPANSPQSSVPGHISLDQNEQGGRMEQPINSFSPSNGTSYYSGSIISGGIDRVLESGPNPVFNIPAYPSHPKPLTDIENYARLLLEFTTVRERVTNWMLHSLLLSRWEVEQLKSRLDAEDPKSPSNWAQLVLAWWEKDMATMPVVDPTQQKGTVSQQKGPLVSENGMWNSGYHSAPERILPDEHTPTFYDYDHPSVVSDDCLSKGGRRSASISSQTSTTEIIGTGHPFVTLLFECEDLKGLFQRASESIEVSIFIVSLKKLLNRFSGALNQEAKSHEEVLACGSIQRAQMKITNLVKERVYDLNTNRNVTPIDNRGDHDHDMRINQHLEQLVEGAPDSRNFLMKRRDNLDDYDEENESSPSLERVKDFILKSAAFDEFRRNLQDLLKKSTDEIFPHVDNGSGQITNFERVEQAPEANMHQEMHLELGHSISNEDSQTTEEEAPLNEIFHHPVEMVVVPSPKVELTAAARGIVERPWVKDSESTRSSPKDTICQVDDLTSNTATTSSAGARGYKDHGQIGTSQGNDLVTTEKYITEMLPTEVIPETQEKAKTRRENDYHTLLNHQGKDHQAQETSKGHEEFDCDDSSSPPLVFNSSEIVAVATTQAGTTERTETGDLIQLPVEPEQEMNTPRNQTRVSRTSNRKEEKFDKRYKEHERSEFEQGKVFKVLWSEPKDSGGEGGTVISVRRGTQGDKVTEKVRRFVIIEAKPEHCLCLSIMTYGGRGTTKGGVNPDNHAIIYTEKPVLLEGETKLAKQAIRVKPYSPQYKLEDASRLNYAKAYTVEYDVKVWFIGEVHQDSTWKLIAACNEIPPFQIRRTPPTLSSCSTMSLIPDEPQSPLMSPAQHDHYPSHKLISAALSQSSGASVIPVTAPQQFSTGQSRGEGHTAWETTKTASYNGPTQFSMQPHLAGEYEKLFRQ